MNIIRYKAYTLIMNTIAYNYSETENFTALGNIL